MNAEFISAAFKNRPIDPLSNAIWWTEHVIATKGKLIQSHARNMDWFTYHSLDVIIPILVVIGLALILTIKLILCGFRSSVPKHDKTKKMQ